MKKIKLLIFTLLISSVSFAQGFFTYINLSNDFLDNLNQGQFEKAQALFDDDVKSKVTPEALQAIWGQIKQQLGDLESIDGAQNKIQDDFQIVIIKCQFKRGEQSFQLVYNNKEKLIGFFLAPQSNVANYKLPAYADSTAYQEKFITIKSGKHELPGMLTLPKSGSNFPVVVFVHGSGPSDMDATIGINKPFKDIAIGLAAHGIASIRYVKRTALYASEFQNKAYTLKEEVTEDALAAINYANGLEEINKSAIYLFGHSLGGALAPRIANSTQNLKGLIFAAAPARSFATIAIEQNNYLLETSKDTSAITKKDFEENIKELQKAGNLKVGSLAPDSVVLGLPVSYWTDINNLDQINLAKKLKNKIYIIQGGNDFQVTETDLNLWKSALKKKKNVTFKLYPMLNHLFSFVNEKGTSLQYAQVGNVDEVLVNDLANWIKN
jgi:dienelactone hydrolase